VTRPTPESLFAVRFALKPALAMGDGLLRAARQRSIEIAPQGTALSQPVPELLSEKGEAGADQIADLQACGHEHRRQAGTRQRRAAAQRQGKGGAEAYEGQEDQRRRPEEAATENSGQSDRREYPQHVKAPLRLLPPDLRPPIRE